MSFKTIRMFSGDRYIPEDKDYERAESARSEEQVMDQMLKITDLDKLCRRCIAFILSSQYGRNIHLWIERAKQLGATENDITELKFAIIDGFTETSEETITNQALLFASKVALKASKAKVTEEDYKEQELPMPSVEESATVQTPVGKENFKGDREVTPESEKEYPILKSSGRLNVEFEDVERINPAEYIPLLVELRPYLGGGSSASRESDIPDRLQRELNNSPFHYNLSLCQEEALFELAVGDWDELPDRDKLYVTGAERSRLDNPAWANEIYQRALENIIFSEDSVSTIQNQVNDRDSEVNGLGYLTQNLRYEKWINEISSSIDHLLQENGVHSQQCYEGYDFNNIIVGFDVEGGFALAKVPLGVQSSLNYSLTTVNFEDCKSGALYYFLDKFPEPEDTYGCEIPVVYFRGAPSFYRAVKPDRRGKISEWDIRLD